jgi:ABC-type branched-subunit amino acid transport system substrate-binding protein
MKKALLLAFLAFWVPSQPPAAAEAPREVVKIGAIVPLTGGLARRGEDVARFLEILGPELTARSQKYRYEFLVEDGRCGAGNAAVSAATKFIIIDGVRFLLTGCSGETLQVGPLAEREKVLLFAVLSNHPDVRRLGEYVFRTFHDVEPALVRFAKYLKSLPNPRVAILTEENAFTFGIRTILKRELGSALVYADDFAADSADLNTLLTRVKAANATILFLNAMSEGTLAAMLQQGRALKLPQKFYCYEFPEASGFLTAAGENAEGLKFLGNPSLTNATADFRRLRARYYELHPEGPSLEFLLMTTYDALIPIAAGIEQVGPNASKVKDFLKTYSAPGASGTVEFDEHGDLKNLPWPLKEIVHGAKVTIVPNLTAD